MSISKHIPEGILANPTTARFVSVLDELVRYKNQEISEGLRAFNVATCLDKSWIISMLQEYGITSFPYTLPMEILLQYALNINTLMELRGCKRGIQMYCSVLSLGEVTIDDSEFFSVSQQLTLNSETLGLLVSDTTHAKYYLTGNYEDVDPLKVFKVTINSKYFNGLYPAEEKAIKEYIEETLPNYLGFSSNKNIIYTYSVATEFIYDSLLNKYYI